MRLVRFESQQRNRKYHLCYRSIEFRAYAFSIVLNSIFLYQYAFSSESLKGSKELGYGVIVNLFAEKYDLFSTVGYVPVSCYAKLWLTPFAIYISLTYFKRKQVQVTREFILLVT